MAAGYRILPEVFDRWQSSYGADFTTLILPQLLTTLNRFGCPDKSLLDAACGTGTLVLEMASRGWSGGGIDLSRGMIEVCRKKSIPPGADVWFKRMDMRAFTVRSPVGLVTSLGDAVNHLLTIRDLRAFLSSAFRALLPGGLLAFDVNNEWCFRNLWKGSSTIRHKDFTMVLENSYVPSRRRALSRIHLKHNRPGPRRAAHEIVEERYFSPDEIRRALSAEAYTVLHAEDFALSSAPEVGKPKTWWVARKA